MEKGTKEILKNIAIIVLVPTVVAGAYYGFKFAHKKYREKKERDKEKDKKENESKDVSGQKTSLKMNKDGSIDTTGMVKYMIDIPSDLREKLFTNGEFFDAILKVPYAFENIGSGGSKGIAVNIKMLPENLQKMNDIVKKFSNEISIVAV